MGSKNLRKYSLEFKQQAVELAEVLSSGRKAAAQLGVSESNIHNWRTLAKAGALVGGASGPVVTKTLSQSAADSAEEVRRLQREVAELKKVNYILKQAAAFFSQDHLK